MTEPTSWVEPAPYGDVGFAVRCITCPAGWYRDAHGNIITRSNRLVAEKVKDRHDRLEHLLSPMGRWGGGR